MSTSCPVCQSQTKKLRNFAENKNLNNEHLSLLKCESCELEFLWPQPSNQWLAEEYKGYFAKRKTQTFSKEEHFKGLLSSLNLKMQKPKVLELGSGEGDCIKACSALWPGSELTAVEANTESKEEYKKLNCRLISSSLEDFLNQSGDEKFDLVLMFDVLEHVRDPRTVLEKLAKLLSPQGLLVASFPNSQALSRTTLKNLWPQYKVEHLFYFSDQSMSVLEKQTHLKRVQLQPLKKELALGYLLNVGSHFGPTVMQKTVRLGSELVPPFLHSKKLKMGFGEWVWVAQKA